MLAIEVKNLSKSYRHGFLLKKKQALKNVSFRINQGDVVGFLGPNGAGKTTTIKSMVGVIYPDSGEIYFFGEKLNKQVKKKIGYLPEAPYFYNYLTGEELLCYFGRFFFSSRKELEERVKDILKLVGLKKEGKQKLKTYSKGMLQRIGLAQALLHDPEIVILDEPMSGLDPVGRKEFKDIIFSLKDKGKTVFFSSHILQDVEMICDKVLIIFNGEIRREGVLEELMEEEVKFFEVTLEGAKHEIFSDSSVISVKGDRILLQVEEKDLEGILRKALDSGFKVKAIVPRHLTLEEIFIREVRKNEGS